MNWILRMILYCYPSFMLSSVRIVWLISQVEFWSRSGIKVQQDTFPVYIHGWLLNWWEYIASKPKVKSSLLCGPICFVVCNGYGSHPSSQVTFLHIYVSCHKGDPCNGVWKDQSKLICTTEKITHSKYSLETQSTSSSLWIPAVPFPQTLATFLHPSEQDSDGTLQVGGKTTH